MSLHVLAKVIFTNLDFFLQTGKSLNDSGLLTTALNILDATVNPTPDHVLASVEYRKYLTKALYYKVFNF